MWILEKNVHGAHSLSNTACCCSLYNPVVIDESTALNHNSLQLHWWWWSRCINIHSAKCWHRWCFQKAAKQVEHRQSKSTTAPKGKLAAKTTCDHGPDWKDERCDTERFKGSQSVGRSGEWSSDHIKIGKLSSGKQLRCLPVMNPGNTQRWTKLMKREQKQQVFRMKHSTKLMKVSETNESLLLHGQIS